MRIENTYGYENLKRAQNKPGRTDEKKDVRSTKPAGHAGTERVRVSEDLISRAAAAEEINTSAVAEAKLALENGDLDKPEVIFETAQRIVDELV